MKTDTAISAYSSHCCVWKRLTDQINDNAPHPIHAVASNLRGQVLIDGALTVEIDALVTKNPAINRLNTVMRTANESRPPDIHGSIEVRTAATIRWDFSMVSSIQIR